MIFLERLFTEEEWLLHLVSTSTLAFVKTYELLHLNLAISEFTQMDQVLLCFLGRGMCSYI